MSKADEDKKTYTITINLSKSIPDIDLDEIRRRVKKTDDDEPDNPGKYCLVEFPGLGKIIFRKNRIHTMVVEKITDLKCPKCGCLWLNELIKVKKTETLMERIKQFVKDDWERFINDDLEWPWTAKKDLRDGVNE